MDIKTESDTTTIKYTPEGKMPKSQAFSLYIQDEDGNNVEPKNYNLEQNKENHNEWTRTFESLKPNKKYYIYTSDFRDFELREDLKFTIELK